MINWRFQSLCIVYLWLKRLRNLTVPFENGNVNRSVQNGTEWNGTKWSRLHTTPRNSSGTAGTVIFWLVETDRGIRKNLPFSVALYYIP